MQEHSVEQLFAEIAQQLRDIEATTEESTHAIMELAERQLENLTQARRMIETAKTPQSQEILLGSLREGNVSLHNDLVGIITALSFHDLTVQRSRKISAALDSLLKRIDASGVKAVVQRPAEPASGAALKGPVRDVSQGNIDDLLARLGS